MQVVRGLPSARRPANGAVVTIGTFDAVHRGHQALLAEVVREAGRYGAEPAVVTFDRHPLEVIAPGNAPCRLQSLDQRLERFEEAGIRLAVVLEFTESFADMEAEDFISSVLIGALGVRKVVVGEDFRFGHRRRGDTAMLTESGAARGFDVETMDLVGSGEAPISSTEVRRLVREGRVEEAAGLLGRAYRLAGTVEHGAGRGGRDLGFPTANVRAHDRACLPGVGVYAGWWRWKGERHPGMINVGVRPTFTPIPEPVTEIHVFDFDRDLYGEHGEVEFTARLRDEVRFESVEALVEQLHRDADAARRALSGRG